jgi:hypothetical protein
MLEEGEGTLMSEQELKEELEHLPQRMPSSSTKRRARSH